MTAGADERSESTSTYITYRTLVRGFFFLTQNRPFSTEAILARGVWASLNAMNNIDSSFVLFLLVVQSGKARTHL